MFSSSSEDELVPVQPVSIPLEETMFDVLLQFQGSLRDVWGIVKDIGESGFRGMIFTPANSYILSDYGTKVVPLECVSRDNGVILGDDSVVCFSDGSSAINRVYPTGEIERHSFDAQVRAITRKGDGALVLLADGSMWDIDDQVTDIAIPLISGVSELLRMSKKILVSREFLYVLTACSVFLVDTTSFSVIDSYQFEEEIETFALNGKDLFVASCTRLYRLHDFKGSAVEELTGDILGLLPSRDGCCFAIYQDSITNCFFNPEYESAVIKVSKDENDAIIGFNKSLTLLCKRSGIRAVDLIRDDDSESLRDLRIAFYTNDIDALDMIDGANSLLNTLHMNIVFDITLPFKYRKEKHYELMKFIKAYDPTIDTGFMEGLFAAFEVIHDKYTSFDAFIENYSQDNISSLIEIYNRLRDKGAAFLSSSIFQSLLDKAIENPGEYYLELCEIKALTSDHRSEYLEIVRGSDMYSYEMLSLRLGEYWRLAELIHDSQDFARATGYLKEAGISIVKPVISYMLEHDYINDVINLEALSEEWRSFDFNDLFSAFEKMGYDPEAAEHLFRAAKSLSFTVDQTATLLSIGMLVLDSEYIEIPYDIRRMLQFLELQKSVIPSETRVLNSQELIEKLIAMNLRSAALFVYSETYEERDNGTNSELLCSIMMMSLRDIDQLEPLIDEFHIRELIPDGFVSKCNERIKADAIRDSVLKMLL